MICSEGMCVVDVDEIFTVDGTGNAAPISWTAYQD